jgi:CheY-like chemotaxis protein
VLHVDDDPGVLELSEHTLDGYRVETLCDPTGVLDHLTGSPVDVLVSDDEMPERSGAALVERVRESHSALPVVTFSGRPADEVLSGGLGAHVDRFIRKGGCRLLRRAH